MAHLRRWLHVFNAGEVKAPTGQALRVYNRAGNVHDSKASVAFLGEAFGQLGTTPPTQRRPVLEMRMDGAFFQPAVIDAQNQEGVEYVIKAPFSSWLELKEPNCQTPPLGTCGRDGEVFGSVTLGTGRSRVMLVALYRKRVRHLTPKNHQLNPFDPDDGFF